MLNFDEMLSIFYQLPEPEGVDFFVLKYDGGQQTAFAIDNRENETLELKNFPDEHSRKAHQQKQKNYNLRKNYQFEKFTVEFNAGIDQLTPIYNGISSQFPRDRESLIKKGWISLQRMLACCGEDIASRREVWQLITAALAGYWARLLHNNKFLPFESGANFRAPILNCTRRDGAEETLIRIIESVALDTSEAFDEECDVYQIAPAVLPQVLSEHRIEDSACIRLVKKVKQKKSGEKIVFYDGEAPAQYRDTAVMLRGRCYTPKVLLDFQQRNPWASILLFAAPDNGLLTDPIRLNGIVFASGKYSDDWQVSEVVQLIKVYADWIWGKKKSKAFKTELSLHSLKYRNWIDTHNHKRGTEKIRGLKSDWLMLQFFVAETLSTVIGDAFNWSSEAISAQANAWCNLLLPGCCQMPDTPEAQEIREQMLSPEDDAINACQEVLKRMLSDSSEASFMYVPRIKNYSEFDTPADGYIREYRCNREKRTTLTLQIREQSFADYAKSFRNANWLLVIDGLRKKNPNWLLPVKTVRMPWIGEKQEKALVFEIEKMDFLSEKQRKFLAGSSRTE